MLLLNSTANATVWLTDWEEQYATLQAVRSEVFIYEQHINEHLEWDEKDHGASHFIVLDQNQTVAGVARLHRTSVTNLATNTVTTRGHIGRMAVLKTQRNKGFGSLLLQSIILYARQIGLHELQLNAQCHALDFYARQGFVPQGSDFKEAGIMHQSMQLVLDQSEPQEKIPARTEHNNNDRIILPDLPAVAAALESLAAITERSFRILSTDLNGELFDNAVLCNSLLALVRKSPHTKIRILVRQTGMLASQSHRLVELYRRLPTRIPIRVLTHDPQSSAMNYVLSDDGGVLIFQNQDGQPNYLNHHDRPLAARLTLEFDELWGQCHDDAELRQIST